jgi:alpha-galactosidase
MFSCVRSVFCFMLFLGLPHFLFSNNVLLDDLEITPYMLQDWGSPIKNKSVLGTPFSVAGVKYTRGIGTHSVSRYMLRLDGKASSITGMVGADDRNDYGGDMEFKILADGELVWTSNIMRKGMPAKKFTVDLSGKKQIVLMVTEGGDGIMYDHADWLEVNIETTGPVIPQTVYPESIAKDKYILTPRPKDIPRINSPKVFGVRPGNPFQYQVAATGKRPMKFTAYQLPAGLSINETTGLITGTIKNPGRYYIVVRADNELGGDFRRIRVEAGDQLALIPPMGWNSWNCWGISVDEQKVKDAADFMSRELINHGWSYINIDDGWEAAKRTKDGELLGNEKFPDFKRLSDYIHSKGLKFGIYSSPGPKTCGGYIGSHRYEVTDARTWANWGVDYLKYDYCSYNEVAPVPTENLIKAPYVLMGEALKQVNRDIVYCVGYGAPKVWYWGQEAGGNQWRTTRDITDDWNIVVAIGTFQDVCAQVTKPGQYNDPDMLVVGKLGGGWGAKMHESKLTPDEQYSHVSLWSLLSSPLLIGCDMNAMDDFTLNLLTNDEVIAVNQDPLVKPANKIITENGQIWYKELEDGSVAIGFFNIDPYYVLWDKTRETAIQEQEYTMSVDLKKLGIDGDCTVRDLWKQEDIGKVKGGYSIKVPYHGVKLLKLTPVKN